MTSPADPLTVLLTSAGGLGYPGVIDSLRLAVRPITVLTADIQTGILCARFSNGHHQLPRGDGPEYIDRLAEVCRTEAVDVVLPGSTPELLALCHESDRFCLDSPRTRVASSLLEATVRCLDKGRCYRDLDAVGLAVPKHHTVHTWPELAEAAAQLGYPARPVCLKPASAPSGGGHGFWILDATLDRIADTLTSRPGSHTTTLEQLELRLAGAETLPELLVMEYLPGDEYSVYILAERGRMLACVPQRRDDLMISYSFSATVVDEPDVERLCRGIVEELGLHSLVNVQVRRDDRGQPKLVEVNPRVGGSVVLATAAGVNLPLLAVLQAVEQLPAHIPEPRTGCAGSGKNTSMCRGKKGRVAARGCSTKWTRPPHQQNRKSADEPHGPSASLVFVSRTSPGRPVARPHTSYRRPLGRCRLR